MWQKEVKMLHGEAVKLEKDEAASIKSKVGLVLFGIYSLIYAGFVFINTLTPKTMGTKIIFGLNLAVVYGFGLIILAIIMGVLYNHYCTKLENRLNKEKPGAGEEEKVEKEADA
jgi:uncharacterized membrane protein (DUF485 family)